MKSFFLITSSLFVVSMAALPATAQYDGVQTYSYSESTHHNSLRLDNTPLVEAISLVGDVSGQRIVIDVATIEAEGISLQTPVTDHITNATVSQMLKDILPEQLVAVSRTRSYLVTTRTRVESGEPDLSADDRDTDPARRSYADAAELSVEQAMQRRIPVHFDHMPLEFAVQMLAGHSGKWARFDRSARSKHLTMVSLHRDGATIRENLDELLESVDLTWQIDGRNIVIMAKDAG